MSKDLSQHVCYFGVNDFFPFNRAELKEAEPDLRPVERHLGLTARQEVARVPVLRVV